MDKAGTHLLVRCESAHEFLDALSPRSPYFASCEPGAWIFRGQAKNWPLVPSALRPNEAAKVIALAGDFEQEGLDERTVQLRKEWFVVRNFFLNAEEAGLLHGFNWEEVSRKFNQSPVMSSRLTADLWPLFGLAQHYGLPTRLLDWTRSARTAAYFAASGIAELKESEPCEIIADDDVRIAVWAIRIRVFRAMMDLTAPDFEHMQYLGLVTPPRAYNANLHAQEGLFTLCNLGPEVDRKPFDEILMTDEVLSHYRQKGRVTRSDMFRFTLPQDQSGKLLKLLAAEGVTAAKLYPGYYGAARAALDRRFWPREARQYNEE